MYNDPKLTSSAVINLDAWYVEISSTLSVPTLEFKEEFWWEVDNFVIRLPVLENNESTTLSWVNSTSPSFSIFITYSKVSPAPIAPSPVVSTAVTVLVTLIDFCAVKVVVVGSVSYTHLRAHET